MFKQFCHLAFTRQVAVGAERGNSLPRESYHVSGRPGPTLEGWNRCRMLYTLRHLLLWFPNLVRMLTDGSQHIAWMAVDQVEVSEQIEMPSTNPMWECQCQLSSSATSRCSWNNKGFMDKPRICWINAESKGTPTTLDDVAIESTGGGGVWSTKFSWSWN